MRTEHLEYLTDIYETQSFSKTAENFLTSHQVISKAMNNLENELNAQIFERAYSVRWMRQHWGWTGRTIRKPQSVCLPDWIL